MLDHPLVDLPAYVLRVHRIKLSCNFAFRYSLNMSNPFIQCIQCIPRYTTHVQVQIRCVAHIPCFVVIKHGNGKSHPGLRFSHPRIRGVGMNQHPALDLDWEGPERSNTTMYQQWVHIWFNIYPWFIRHSSSLHDVQGSKPAMQPFTTVQVEYSGMIWSENLGQENRSARIGSLWRTRVD